MTARRRERARPAWRRRLPWSAAGLAAVLAYVHVTSSSFLLARLREALGRGWTGEILVERIGYTPWGGLVAEHLVLPVPDAGGLEVGRLRVRFNPFRGLLGQSVVTDLELSSPTLILPAGAPREALARWPFARGGGGTASGGERRGSLLLAVTDFRLRSGEEELLRVPQLAVRCAYLSSAGVSDVTGEVAGPAWSSGSFRISYGADGCRWDGALHGLRLLPETRGMLWPHARAAWDLFSPSGTVELTSRGSLGPAGGSAFTVEATTRDGEITWRHFPLPFRGIHGTLAFDETGRVELRGLWGTGAGALTTCEGAAGGREDRSFLQLHITVQDLPLAPGVVSAMPAGLRELRDWAGAEGTLSGSLGILRSSAAPDAADFHSTWWFKSLAAERLPMRPVILAGSMDLRGRMQGHEVAGLEGALRIPRGELAGHALDGCLASFSRDGRGLRMAITEGRLAGGDLKASMERSSGPGEPENRAVLDLANARIEELKLGTVLSEQAIHGAVSGHAEIAWTGSSLQNLSGRGAADLKDGYLFSLPPLSRPLALLSLNLGQEDPVIRSGRMAFRLQGDRMKLDLLELPSDPVTVRSHGVLSRDGRVDLRVIASPGGPGVLRKIPVLKETTGGIRRFLDWVQDRGLYVFRVKGTVSEPAVEQVRLFGLANKEVRLYHDLLEGRPAPEAPE